MFLLDVSGTIFGAIHVEISKGEVPTLNTLRHLIINSIRYYNVSFRHKYGEMIICCDGGSWRKKEFPLYKYVRKQERENESDQDWSEIFKHVEQIINDLRDHFPYKVLREYGAEADDIIGALVTDHCKKSNEPILIVSNDKDFGGLQRYRQVSQWRPMIASRQENFEKGWFRIDDPNYFEFELVMHGDESDGVPSIKCPDDFYKNKYEAKLNGEKTKRAPSITKKLKNELYPLFMHEPEAFAKKLTKDEVKNFKRNAKLISLSQMPDDIRTKIMDGFENAESGTMITALDFMRDNGMGIMASSIKDFDAPTPTRSKALDSIFVKNK